MLLLHGSKSKNLSELTPLSTLSGLGVNGAMYGEGVYLSNSAKQAAAYSGHDGSVYVVDIDEEKLTPINESELSSHQIELLEEYIDGFPNDADIAVVSTKIAGRQEHRFLSESEAEEFYESEMVWAKKIGFSLLEPEFEEDSNGYIVVSSGRKYADYDQLQGATTRTVFDALNGVSPATPKEFFEKFTYGIIVDQLDSSKHYIYYDPINPLDEILLNPSSELEAITQIELELESIEQRQNSFVVAVDRHLLIYADDKGTLHNEMITNQKRNPYEIELCRFPKPHIWVERGSGENPAIQKAIINLIKSNPEWADSELRFDNYRVAAEEYLSNLNQDEQFAYHGTSTHTLEKIMSLGVQSRNLSGAEAHYIGSAQESLPDRSYFCTKSGIGAAIFAAESAAKKHPDAKPIIIKVNMRHFEPNHMVPDEDSKKQTAQESINTIGCFAYTKTIEPTSIELAEESFIPESLRTGFGYSMIKSKFNDHKLNLSPQIITLKESEKNNKNTLAKKPSYS